jgi:tRNA-splicing ligase RtcB
MDDAIFERSEFNEIPMVRHLKNKARKQIGSSGSGNHFVDFGIVSITDVNNDLGLEVGEYLGLLSHSGSRGLGATIAKFYTDIAMSQCLLPKHAKNLAWLDMDSEAGQEYWLAMNLAGDYASACHHHIHHRIARALGEQSLTMVENHHNFAWKETLANGKEVIVHRKGSTPAAKGVLGIIPGSMTAPAFIVRGKGNEQALNSAAHGAGRAMSRTKARNSFTNKEMRQLLKKKQVDLIGGALDESPMAYKDIHQVMSAQHNLVDVLGTFLPKIVRMDRS